MTVQAQTPATANTAYLEITRVISMVRENLYLNLRRLEMKKLRDLKDLTIERVDLK